MKNINKLKKEIEEGGEGIGGAQIQLQILQQVCKEIKKEIEKCKGYGIKKGKVNTLIILEELLKKFQGESNE